MDGAKGHFSCCDSLEKLIEWFDGFIPQLLDSGFRAYPNLAYGEMDETSTDEDVLDNFCTLNHSGVPMSKEHIDFVRSINLK